MRIGSVHICLTSSQLGLLHLIVFREVFAIELKMWDLQSEGIVYYESTYSITWPIGRRLGGMHSSMVESKRLLQQRMNLRVTTGEQYFLCCGKPPLIFLLVVVAAKAICSCKCLWHAFALCQGKPAFHPAILQHDF